MRIDLRRAEPTSRWVLPAAIGTQVAVLLVAMVVVGTRWSPVMRFDDSVAASAYGFSRDHDIVRGLLEVVSWFFNVWPVTVLVAALTVFAVWRQRHRVALWAVASGLAVLIGNPVLKLIFRRDRPHWESPIVEIGGYSFPSGHSAAAGMVFTIALLLTLVSTGRGFTRRALLTGWVLLTITVAASRVFLGVHYVSDVVGGVAFGSAVTLALWVVIVHGSGARPDEASIFTGLGRRTSAVVLNPAKVGDVEAFKDRVRLVSGLHGWSEPLWFETTVEDPGYGQAREALAADVDLVVVAGGDGTVRAVCDVAARQGVAVGIVPQGTGNLLARNLSIPLNTRDALDVVFGGTDRAIDLARFARDEEEPTSFLVMAGMGLDAAIMAGVNEDLKSRVGYLAYFVSGIKASMFPLVKVTVTVDDEEPQHFRARTVVVGNVGALQGGIPLLPEAKIDDGLLDVVVIAPRRLFNWLHVAWGIVSRRRANTEQLARMSGRRISVSAEKTVPMQLDGDPVGDGREIVAEVSQGVLLVRVPSDLRKSD